MSFTIITIIALSGCHFSLVLPFSLRLSSHHLFLILCVSLPSPLLPFSQGNQWEPVTACEQRHYSGDSVCPIKHKNPETAGLIESGGVKVSVSSRTEQQRMCLKDVNSSQSHINTQKMPGCCVPFGLNYFCERDSSRYDKTKHKRNTLQRAVNCIYMFISLCCGHQLKIRSLHH